MSQLMLVNKRDVKWNKIGHTEKSTNIQSQCDEAV